MINVMNSILALILISLPLLTFSQRDKDTTLLVQHVQFLASPDNEGRLTGSFGELRTAEYLEERLEELGAQPISCGFTRPFNFAYEYKTPDEIKVDSLSGLNVVGFFNYQKDKTILIGAHYDHLGRNEYGSGRNPEKTGEIHFGADDNASGVAAVLELARRLTKNKENHSVNYIIAFFSGEELGLQGSKKLVNELREMELPISFMLNFDMVGRLNQERELTLEGVGTGDLLDSLIQLINTDYDFQVRLSMSGVGASDYTPFYLDSIPVLGLTTGVHQDYHTIYDTPEKLNYRGLLEVIQYSYDLVQTIAEEEIRYMETPVSTSRSRSSLKVSLGIMPGYGSSNGLMIEAVMDDKPAKKAGLQRGDEIVGIDECIVNSIHDYMDCLSTYDRGDTVVIRYLREEKEQEITLTF
jgi:hypothetical protein